MTGLSMTGLSMTGLSMTGLSMMRSEDDSRFSRNTPSESENTGRSPYACAGFSRLSLVSESPSSITPSIAYAPAN
jgi:hypothetical protein